MTINPIFAAILANFAPKTEAKIEAGQIVPDPWDYQDTILPVSPYLTRPLRSLEQARAEPFLTQPQWQIWVEPKRGEYQSLSLEWPDATNAMRALHVLRMSLGDESAFVIHIAEDGTRTDVSAWFASLWLAQLKDEGMSTDDAIRIPFISRHAEEFAR